MLDNQKFTVIGIQKFKKKYVQLKTSDTIFFWLKTYFSIYSDRKYRKLIKLNYLNLVNFMSRIMEFLLFYFKAWRKFVKWNF